MANASVRPAAVAGQFYPGDPRVLHSEIGTLLGAAAPPARPDAAPKALIVPHAGYMYSGAVAASAYTLLRPFHAAIGRVVLLGPAHRVAVHGAALPAALAFETPLGTVPVDREEWVRLQHLDGIVVSEAAHAFEHALEVQLPFLQSVLDRFSIVPLVVGRIEPARLAEIIEFLWGGPETLLVVSSDLSHYHGYSEAKGMDRSTCERIVRLQEGIDHEQACGATPVNGLLTAARRHGLRARLLDQRNSGDTAGPRDRVVGYASFAFAPELVDARH